MTTYSLKYANASPMLGFWQSYELSQSLLQLSKTWKICKGGPEKHNENTRIWMELW